FTKNLSPDKINLSTLKGEGQLSNLELDEEVLQNMLDLPTWLSISRVYCNKAAIRIQWTKLKTSPICLFLDKVEVEMMTCEEPRPPNGPSPIAITAGQSEYGFAEKVVEGMSVIINSIVIKVKSRAFHASFELWQLQGFSLNPKWQKTDLRYTRITHPKRGEVLTFKEINWQSLRIEADAIKSEDQDLGSTPLRLITNQGRIRIALKRRVKDCNVLASKLLFILDDLLWVLTDSQLKAVIHYAKSLSEAMEKSAQQRKSMETVPTSPGPRPPWPEPHPAPVATPNTLAEYFDLYDVKESSYHTFISRLDLHICNDSLSSETDEPPIPGSQGAMQLTFRKMGFDYYPFHRPSDGCRHWERYCSALDSRTQWASKLLQDFQKKLESSGFPQPSSEPCEPNTQSPAKKLHGDGESVTVTNADEILDLKKLRSSCMVIRVDDLDIHQLTECATVTQNREVKEFVVIGKMGG
ncbi:UHRF1-binding protein 1, partial [Tachysurus ichikawai]